MDRIGALGFWFWAQCVPNGCLQWILGYNEISEYMMKFLRHLTSVYKSCELRPEMVTGPAELFP